MYILYYYNCLINIFSFIFNLAIHLVHDVETRIILVSGNFRYGKYIKVFKYFILKMDRDTYFLFFNAYVIGF